MPDVGIEMIDAKTATKMLEGNTHNRAINQARVRQFASDMADGRWMENGESLKFDMNGTLQDGQHRLWAVIESDTSQPMVVVRGLFPEAQDTMDIGASRTTGQILRLNGQTNPNFAAAVAHLLLRWDRHPDSVWSGHKVISKTEIVQHATDIADRLPEPLQMGQEAGSLGGHRTAYAAVAFRALHDRQINPTAWYEFHERVTAGQAPMGDPTNALRRYWMHQGRQSTPWQQQTGVAIVVKAFNDVMAGRSRKTLIFRESELPMPVLKLS